MRGWPESWIHPGSWRGALHQPPTGQPQVPQVGRTLPQTWELGESLCKLQEVVGSTSSSSTGWSKGHRDDSTMMTSRHLIGIDHVWLALKSSSQSVNQQPLSLPFSHHVRDDSPAQRLCRHLDWSAHFVSIATSFTSPRFVCVKLFAIVCNNDTMNKEMCNTCSSK